MRSRIPTGGSGHLRVLATLWLGLVIASASGKPSSDFGLQIPDFSLFRNPQSAIRNPWAANDRLGIDHVNLMALEATDEMLDERYRRAVEAGAGWTRYEIRWDMIESRAGFDYHKADAIVLRDVASGLKIDAILNATPDAYATAGLTSVPGPRIGQQRFTKAQMAGLASAASPPANLYEPVFADSTDEPAPGKPINPSNYWARFVSQTVQRYMPDGVLAQEAGWPDGIGIRVWEIWNEPDRPFWTGTVEDYYRLLKVASLVIKTTDPKATVMLAGLAHWPSPDWPPSIDWFPRFLQTVSTDPNPALRDAYNQYFDVAAWHWYSNPRHLYEKTVEMRSLMSQYGITGKEIWVNESGVPIWEEFPGPYWDPNSPLRATLREQAAWVFQAFAEGFAAGVKRIFFFQLYDDCGNGPEAWDAFGLIRNPVGTIGQGACAEHPEHPGEPRPSYTAYQVAADVFRDVQPVWRYHNYTTGLGRVALFRPPNERVLVLWNWDFEDKSFDIYRTGTSGELIGLEGNRQRVTPNGSTYEITLPAATNTNWSEPGAMIGGQPYILIEEDSLTPTARIDPLPEASSPNFEVSWDLQDWGTGVAAYDIRYSDGRPETPEDWQLLVEEPALDPPRPRVQGAVSFTGEFNHTYYFVARARDWAGNWSEPGTSQVSTTVQSGGGVITGQVFDIRRQPVASATVEVKLDTGSISAVLTDDDGRFTVPDLDLSETYGLSAVARGYGTWSTRWGVTPVASGGAGIELQLPPADNRVTNGGFENGDLDGWERSGETLPRRSNFGLSGTDSAHPRAALLGFQTDGRPPKNSTLSQVIQLPAGVPALGFWYKVYRRSGSVPDSPENRFRVLVRAGSGRAEPKELYIETLSDSVQWRYQWVDFSAFAGQEVKLIFDVYQPAADFQTVVYLDQVSVGRPGPLRLPQHLFLPLISHSRP